MYSNFVDSSSLMLGESNIEAKEAMAPVCTFFASAASETIWNMRTTFLEYVVSLGIVVADEDHAEAYPGSASSKRPTTALKEKWWLPFLMVPAKGLSEGQESYSEIVRKCTQQIFKATVGINSSMLSEMEVPQAYLEDLPKKLRI